ncbi:hypothetical protein CK203_053431 [Vitis vinifera]|uniref:Uncharacterized protein n=1 Tax=Vitis vinifera TaxID=29760 RepID=A0A438GZ48_VITVI|nr:hypothetical protein CK203_053431 [Vitis vinifera]
MDSPLKLNTPVDAILHFFDLSLSRSDRHVKDDLYNISEVGVLEEKVVAIGLEEALLLLHCALHSKEALTKVFLR